MKPSELLDEVYHKEKGDFDAIDEALNRRFVDVRDVRRTINKWIGWAEKNMKNGSDKSKQNFGCAFHHLKDLKEDLNLPIEGMTNDS